MKILNTRNYRLFLSSSGENRPLDIRKHRELTESMKEYGFLDTYPIIVYRDKDGNLVVKDGQHRLAIAERLGLPVYYVETKTDFNVAKANGGQKPWGIKDYAQMYATKGVKPYVEGLEFAERYSLPIGVSFSLLSGTTGFSKISEHFHNGTFKVKDRTWAEAVASVYTPLIRLSSAVRGTRLIEACMAVCRVPDFDADRLIQGAEKCREKLVAYSTREANLDMLENIYNFHRHKLVGLKAAATMAMRERMNGNGKKPVD